MDGADAARACAGAPEPGPADAGCAAQGSTYHCCISAAVSETQIIARMARQNDRGAQHGKRRSPRHSDHRPSTDWRSSDPVQIKRCRESLARLRQHPKVALTIFATGNLAFTARGPARVVQESMVVAPAFAAVAIDVENIDDHRQRELVIDSGVSLDWTNERTQRFLQEHLKALREVAASGESGRDAQSNPEAIHEVARISKENLAVASRYELWQSCEAR